MFLQAGNGGLLAVDQKQAACYRAPLGNPPRQFRSVGMSGIVVNAADIRRNLDLVALDTNGFHSVGEKPAKSAVGLKANQQYGGPRIPKPILQMVPDASGVTHSATCDNNVKA